MPAQNYSAHTKIKRKKRAAIVILLIYIHKAFFKNTFVL